MLTHLMKFQQTVTKTVTFVFDNPQSYQMLKNLMTTEVKTVSLMLSFFSSSSSPPPPLLLSLLLFIYFNVFLFLLYVSSVSVVIQYFILIPWLNVVPAENV